MAYKTRYWVSNLKTTDRPSLNKNFRSARNTNNVYDTHPYLKAWADLVARAGETFRYTEHAPIGLLENKKAYIVTITGGAPLNSHVDFLTPWLRQFVQFLGISDVQLIAAEGFKKDPDGPLNAALTQIKALSW